MTRPLLGTLGFSCIMAKRIGAIVALACLAVLVVGGVFLSTPTGKKTVHFIDEVQSSTSIQAMRSPSDLGGCVMAGCGVSTADLGMFP